MNYKRFIVIILFLASVISLSGRNITLQKAREIALKKNYEVLSKKLQQSMTHDDYWEAIYSFFPSGTYGGSYTSFNPGIAQGPNEMESSLSHKLTFTQPIFLQGKLWLALKMAGFQEKAEELNTKAKELEIINLVTEKYYAVLQNTELVKISKRSLEAAEKHEKSGIIRYEGKSLAKADYLKLKTDLAARKLEYSLVQNGLEIAIKDLSFLLQEKEVAPVLIPREKIMIEIEQLKNTVIKHKGKNIASLNKVLINENPNIQVFEQSLKLLQQQIYMQQGEYLPNINLAYIKEWSKSDYEDEYADQGTLALSASIDIFPIINKTKKVDKVKKSYRQNELALKKLKDDLSLALNIAYMNLENAISSVESAKEARDFAKETYDAMQIRFDAGLVSSADLIDTEVMYKSQQQNFINYLYSYQTSKTKLAVMLGFEDDEQLLNLIK